MVLKRILNLIQGKKPFEDLFYISKYTATKQDRVISGNITIGYSGIVLIDIEDNEQIEMYRKTTVYKDLKSYIRFITDVTTNLQKQGYVIEVKKEKLLKQLTVNQIKHIIKECGKETLMIVKPNT